MEFSYRAIDRHGSVIHGSLTAASRASASLHLQHRQLEVLGLRRRLGRGKRLRGRELLDFCSQLQQLLEAGIPIIEALGELRGTNAGDGDYIARLIDDIEGGATLAGAMRAQPRAFPELALTLVRAGEQSGTLVGMLERYVHSLRWQESIASYRQRLLIYPSFVAAAVGGAMIFLMLNLVPQLRQFSARNGQELPMHAQVLFASADALSAAWPGLLLAVILTAAGFLITRRCSRRFRLATDHLRLRLPLFGEIQRRLLLAQLADHFALLYAAGIPVLETLSLLQPTLRNEAAMAALTRVADGVRSGLGLSAAFAEQQIFAGLLIRMLRIGEQTGALDRSLQHAADYYRHSVEEATARLQAAMEPLLTLLLGLLLGWIMLSVLGPLYDFIGSVR